MNSYIWNDKHTTHIAAEFTQFFLYPNGQTMLGTYMLQWSPI